MLIIGITGGTGCGKTTVVNQIINELPENEVGVISQDSYYNDLSHLSMEERVKVNFDHPNSIDFNLLAAHLEALKKGDFDRVGRTMTENQLMLSSIGVSSPELDNLIKAASPSSLGAKLTGAGGGGCMVALTKKPKETSDAIELAGGRTLISRLGSSGLSIDDSQNAPLWTKA